MRNTLAMAIDFRLSAVDYLCTYVTWKRQWQVENAMRENAWANKKENGNACKCLCGAGGGRGRRRGDLFTMKGDAQSIRLKKDNPDFIVRVISHAFHDGVEMCYLFWAFRGFYAFWSLFLY